MPMDTATVVVQNAARTAVDVLMRSHNCDKCKEVLWVVKLAPNHTKQVSIQTDFPVDLSIVGSGTTHVEQSFVEHFGDQGLYNLVLNATSHTVTTTQKPLHDSIPLVVAVCVFIALGACFYVFKRWYASTYIPLEVDDETVSTRRKRVMALDAFRGMCITVMIFVNYGGGGYWFLSHSRWDGLTVADLVFPWFIWIMGVSMVISLQSLEKRGTPAKVIWRKISIRSAKLFALGLFLAKPTVLTHWRIPGVLQRFAVSYFCTAGIMLLIPKWGDHEVGLSSSAIRIRKAGSVPNGHIQGDPETGSSGDLLPKAFPKDSEQSQGSTRWLLMDVKPFVFQWVAVLLLITVWLLITFLLPVPGCPTGYIGPGGLHDGGKYPSACVGGAAGYIDRKVFGENHIYQHPTCVHTYKCAAYDPEGLLGCLTSIALCFFGVQAGRTLVTFSDSAARVQRWLTWGVVLGSIGVILCYGEKFGGVIPICKNLWSVSFILIMAGTGFCMLALLYVLVDVQMLWAGKPFLYVGMNSIVLYMGSELFGRYFPFGGYKWPDTHAGQLTENLIGVSCWVMVGWWLHASNIFVAL